MFKYVIKYKKFLLYATFLGVVLGVLDVVQGLILRLIVDASTGNITNLTFLDIGAMTVIFVIFNIVVYLLFQKNQLYVSSSVCKDLKNDLISNIFRGSRVDNNMNFMSTLNKDIDIIHDKLLINIFRGIRIITSFCIAITYLFYINVYVAFSVLLCGIGSLILPKVFINRGAMLRKNYSVASASFMNTVKESLYGISTIKLFLLDEEYKKRNFDKNFEVEQNRLKSFYFDDFMQIIISSTGFLILAVNVILAAYLSKRGLFSIGTALSIMQVMNYVINPINQGPVYYSEIKSTQVLVDNLTRYIDSKGSRGTEIIEEEIKSIDFSKVCYSYNDNSKLAIDDVNIKFENKKKYLILGASGSGKTTLLNILTKLTDGYTGEVLLNNIPLKKINVNSLRKKIVYVEQEAFIFNNTLRYNICLGQEVSDERLLKIAERLNLKSLGGNFEINLEMVLEENGNNLSGGEKQRVSFARALIRDPDIILIDEGTSSLDKKNSMDVDTLINDLKCMVIAISHKVNSETLKSYDEVIIFDDGKVITKGKYDDVKEYIQPYIT